MLVALAAGRPAPGGPATWPPGPPPPAGWPRCWPSPGSISSNFDAAVELVVLARRFGPADRRRSSWSSASRRCSVPPAGRPRGGPAWSGAGWRPRSRRRTGPRSPPRATPLAELGACPVRPPRTGAARSGRAGVAGGDGAGAPTPASSRRSWPSCATPAWAGRRRSWPARRRSGWTTPPWRSRCWGGPGRCARAPAARASGS